MQESTGKVTPSASDQSFAVDSPSVRSASSDSSPEEGLSLSWSGCVIGVEVRVRLVGCQKEFDIVISSPYANLASLSASETPSSPSESERFANAENLHDPLRSGRECLIG